MSLPKVSAVIATRDRPELLREAVDAVASQDYPGFIEVIVVYDQSTPDMSLASQSDQREIRVMANRRTPGLAGARNSGIEAASGEFVAFCDDDDLWMRSKISAQVGRAQHSGANFITGGIKVVYDGAEHVRVISNDSVSFGDLLLDRHTELHPSTFFIRRSYLLGTGDDSGSSNLVDELVPGGFGEDYEFLLRAARAAPIENIAEPVALVRWGGQSFFFRRWETMADGLAWLLTAYPEFESQPRGSARIRGQIAFAYAASGQRRESLRWARSALVRNYREPRILLAVATALKIVSPGNVMEFLHKRGRGI